MKLQYANKTYDEIAIGDFATMNRTVTEQDIQLFATVSGDFNPAHVDAEYCKETRFQQPIAHGMFTGALISAVLGTQLPGPGTIYLKQDLSFKRPVFLGDELEAKVTVREKEDEKKQVWLDCVCTNQAGKEVVSGEALIIAPTESVSAEKEIAFPRVELIQE